MSNIFMFTFSFCLTVIKRLRNLPTGSHSHVICMGDLWDFFSHLLGLIVSKGSGSCLNQIFGFEPENDTKSIVSIIGPQNVGPLEPPFDPDM